MEFTKTQKYALTSGFLTIAILLCLEHFVECGMWSPKKVAQQKHKVREP